MQHVFISHRSKDKQRIAPILLALLETGAHIWIDRPQDLDARFDPYRDQGQVNGIPAGESWGRVIDLELPVSPLVLLFVSAEAIASNHVLLELQKSKRRGTLVPIYLEPIYGYDLPQLAADLLDVQGYTLYAEDSGKREREVREIVRVVVERLGIGSLAEARRTSAALADTQRRIAMHFYGSEEDITCEDVLLGRVQTCRLVPTRPDAGIADSAPLYVSETSLRDGQPLTRTDLESLLSQQTDLWRLPFESEVGAIVDPLGVCTAGAPHPFGLAACDAGVYWARREDGLIVVDRLGAPANVAAGVAFLVYSG